LREIAVFGGTAHPALSAGICADLIASSPALPRAVNSTTRRNGVFVVAAIRKLFGRTLPARSNTTRTSALPCFPMRTDFSNPLPPGATNCSLKVEPCMSRTMRSGWPISNSL